MRDQGNSVDRLAGGVLHRLVDREHVVVIDRQPDLEGQARRRCPRTASPACPALSVSADAVQTVSLSGSFTWLAGAGASSRTGCNRAACSDQRLQQADQRRIRADRLVVVRQHQVVEAAPSRLMEPATRGASIFSRGTFRRRAGGAPGRAGAGGCRAGECRLAAVGGVIGWPRVWRGWCRRLRQMRCDQELEAQQDRERYRDRQEEPFLVHQARICPAGRRCVTLQEPGGTGS